MRTCASIRTSVPISNGTRPSPPSSSRRSKRCRQGQVGNALRKRCKPSKRRPTPGGRRARSNSPPAKPRHARSLLRLACVVAGFRDQRPGDCRCTRAGASGCDRRARLAIRTEYSQIRAGTQDQTPRGPLLRVSFRAGCARVRLAAALADIGGEIVGGPGQIGVYLVRVKEGDLPPLRNVCAQAGRPSWSRSSRPSDELRSHFCWLLCLPERHARRAHRRLHAWRC